MSDERPKLNDFKTTTLAGPDVVAYIKALNAHIDKVEARRDDYKRQLITAISEITDQMVENEELGNKIEEILSGSEAMGEYERREFTTPDPDNGSMKTMWWTPVQVLEDLRKAYKALEGQLHHAVDSRQKAENLLSAIELGDNKFVPFSTDEKGMPFIALDEHGRGKLLLVTATDSGSSGITNHGIQTHPKPQ